VTLATASPGFWAGYWQSLKSLDVEEPIDVYVHRPLAYLLARALLPTPVSPNLVTIASMLIGVYGAYLMVADLPYHWQWAALCTFLGTVFDCADGQLARMRKTSSVIGRMLDGTADVIVTAAILAAGGYHLYFKYGATNVWLGWAAVLFTLVAGVATSIQTTLFDHYKTVFMKLAVPGFKEAESYPEARRRYEAQKSFTLVSRLAWALYLQFVGNQSRTVRKFDPHTVTEFSILGDYDPARAQIYREHMAAVMGTWRRWFGYGSLMIGITLALALELPEYYLLARLTVYGLVFYGPLMLRQRRASARAFAALGVEPR
jgi:phosphatidylglycerophosphate synthase